MANANDDDDEPWVELRALKGHGGVVISASCSPDGTRIVTASRDKTVRVWDAVTGSCLSTLKGHANCVFSASYSPDGTHIASASSDKTVRVWDAATGACVSTLEGHTDWVRSVCYSPDGMRILSASRDKTVRVWDAVTGSCLSTLKGHASFVRSASYSPDSTHIASASSDKTVRVWDAATGACVSTLEGHTDWVRSVCYSPDGTRIVTASNDKTVRVWIRRGSRAAAGPSSSNIDDVAFAGERNAEEVREAKKQKLGVVDVCASPNNNGAGAAAETPTPDPPSSTHLLPLIQRIVQILCKGARAAASDDERTMIRTTIAKVGKGKCDAAKVATYVDTLPQDLTSVTDDEAFAMAIALCSGI